MHVVGCQDVYLPFLSVGADGQQERQAERDDYSGLTSVIQAVFFHSYCAKCINGDAKIHNIYEIRAIIRDLFRILG
jgi:hypothetical protein